MSKKSVALIIVIGIIAIIMGITLATPTHTYTLNASVNPPQAGSVSPSGGEYELDAQLTLTASAASGYTFDYWSGNGSGTSPSVTVTMDSDRSITANFKAITSVTHNLTISASGQGVTNPSVGTYEYDSGTQVTIAASPASGWKFDNWTGDVGTITDVNATSTSITVNDSYSITASFQEVDAAPDFTLPTMLGANITLSELKETPVVLNFWSISCYWCRKQLPYLENVAKQSVGEIRVVAINIVDSVVSLEYFFTDYEPTMIVALDSNRETFWDYCLKYENPRKATPFTLFVDSEGIMRYKQLGAFPSETALWDTLHNVFGP